MPISVHFHNDFGLATANTLTAIECGADQAHVTVNGLGERTGNCSLEELVMTLKASYGIDLGLETSRLYSLSTLVGRLTGVKMLSTSRLSVIMHLHMNQEYMFMASLTIHPPMSRCHLKWSDIQGVLY